MEYTAKRKIVEAGEQTRQLLLEFEFCLWQTFTPLGSLFIDHVLIFILSHSPARSFHNSHCKNMLTKKYKVFVRVLSYRTECMNKLLKIVCH